MSCNLSHTNGPMGSVLTTATAAEQPAFTSYSKIFIYSTVKIKKATFNFKQELIN